MPDAVAEVEHEGQSNEELCTHDDAATKLHGLNHGQVVRIGARQHHHTCGSDSAITLTTVGLSAVASIIGTSRPLSTKGGTTLTDAEARDERRESQTCAAVSDGEHGGDLRLVDGEVGRHRATQPLVLGPVVFSRLCLEGSR